MRTGDMCLRSREGVTEGYRRVGIETEHYDGEASTSIPATAAQVRHDATSEAESSFLMSIALACGEGE